MKRILSMILTLVMIASSFVLAIPTASAAADTTVYTEVATLDQFVAALAAKKNIKLTADITLKKNTKYKLYTTTTLNGNGHTIYIPEMDNNTNAPFAWAVDTSMANYQSTTTIKNVNFGSADNPFVHTNKTQTAMGLFTGIVAGYYTHWENVNIYYKATSPVACTIGAAMPTADGTHSFVNCNAYVDITDASNAAGGWIGSIGASCTVTMTNCKTYGQITNVGSTAGGITGMLQGSLTLTNCTNYANMGSQTTANNDYGVSGFVPYTTDKLQCLTMTGCVNYGDIAGRVQAGGLLGKILTSTTSVVTLTDCANYGYVKAFDGNGAGIAAQLGKGTLLRCANFGTATGYNAGGMIGNASNIIATDCINAGTIIGERMGNTCAGGLFGYTGVVTMNNCANVGTIKQINGNSYGAGNLIGHLIATASATNCYAFGTAWSHADRVGVLVGTKKADTGLLTASGCQYVDFGASDPGAGCTEVTLAQTPAILKTALNRDFVIGERNVLVDATPQIRGVQTTTPDASKHQSVRVLATMSKALTSFKRVGYDVQATLNSHTGGKKSYSASTVYANINNKNGNGDVQISARELHGEYIYTLEVNGVPTVNSKLTLVITPWTTDGTNTWYGETKTLVFQNGKYTEDTMSEINTAIDPVVYGSPLPQKINTPLYQKSVLFCGDSICYGSQDRGVYAPSRSWSGRIGYIHDMDYVNAGISSASVSNDRIDYSIIVDQAAKYKEREFDFVLLHGGVNDAWGTNGSAPTPVGTVTPAGTTTFDLNTFAGGLENLLYKVKQFYPNAKIGYIINFYAPNCSSGTVSEMSQYVDMMKIICDKYDVPYLDLYNNAELTAKLRVTSDIPAERVAYIPDNIHPGAGGYDAIYPYIEEFMLTRLAGEAPTPTPSTETLKLGGVDISQYTIIYERSDEAAEVKNYWRPEYDGARITAERLADLLEEKFGFRPKVYSDVNAPETTYEILVGNTNRAASASSVITSLTTDEYYVGMSGKKLLICGGALGTTYHAVDSIERYFNTTVANGAYAITASSNLSGEYHLERIAVLGDSISVGAISTNYLNNGGMRGYAKQIGRMDWTECVVSVYAQAGTCLRTDMSGFMTINKWTNFTNDAQANPFDTVLIMLGINDANTKDKNGGWQTSDDAPFLSTLKTMVQSIATMNPDAEVVIMTCCVHFRVAGNTPGYVPIASSSKIVSLQKQAASELKAAGYNVHLFDMNAYSTAKIIDSAAMFDKDLLHPSDMGHEILAKGVVNMLRLLREGKTGQYLLY